MFLVYLISYDPLGLPSIETVIGFIERGFTSYGLWFLFLGLILEGLFVFGFYFPGSIIAFMAVLTLGNTYGDVFLIIFVGSLALILVNIVNYWLGKHGYYKLLNRFGAYGTIERMGKRFDKNEKGAILLFSSSPNFLAITSIYAGIVQAKLFRYLRFMSLCIVFWVSLVSSILFIFLRDFEITSLDNAGWYSLVIMIVWALWESFSSYKK